MKIRPYTDADWSAVKRLHEASGLPPECMPNLQSPLFKIKMLAEDSRGISQAGLIRLTGEAFVLVDRSLGTPEERWTTLQRLTASVLSEAASQLHLRDVSCWIPPQIEKSFAPRLEALGFLRSPWHSYTALLGE